MRTSRLILFFGVLFIFGCVTPNRLKKKAELDKIIISNFEKELMFEDTILFESFPIWCGNTLFSGRLSTFEPIGKDSNFMFQIKKQVSQKVYFSNISCHQKIDSSYYYFICEGEIKKRRDFNSVIKGGKCVSRRKIRVIETYNIGSSRKVFDKMYQYKKRSMEAYFWWRTKT